MSTSDTTALAAPAADITQLSEDDFKKLVESGQTLTISGIKALLAPQPIGADMLKHLGIKMRNLRSAVHINADDYPALCDGLAAHAKEARNKR